MSISEMTIHTPHCTHSTLYTLHSVHTPLCTHSTVYTLHSVHTPLCTHSTVYTLHSVHTPHCTHSTVYTLHSVHTPHCHHHVHCCYSQPQSTIRDLRKQLAQGAKTSRVTVRVKERGRLAGEKEDVNHDKKDSGRNTHVPTPDRSPANSD